MPTVVCLLDDPLTAVPLAISLCLSTRMLEALCVEYFCPAAEEASRWVYGDERSSDPCILTCEVALEQFFDGRLWVQISLCASSFGGFAGDVPGGGGAGNGSRAAAHPVPARDEFCGSCHDLLGLGASGHSGEGVCAARRGRDVGPLGWRIRLHRAIHGFRVLRVRTEVAERTRPNKAYSHRCTSPPRVLRRGQRRRWAEHDNNGSWRRGYGRDEQGAEQGQAG